MQCILDYIIALLMAMQCILNNIIAPLIVMQCILNYVIASLIAMQCIINLHLSYLKEEQKKDIWGEIKQQILQVINALVFCDSRMQCH